MMPLRSYSARSVGPRGMNWSVSSSGSVSFSSSGDVCDDDDDDDGDDDDDDDDARLRRLTLLFNVLDLLDSLDLGFDFDVGRFFAIVGNVRGTEAGQHGA